MQKIFTFLMFVGKQQGNAEGGMNYYVSLFRNSKVITIERYGSG
jgi:predicted 3-demethylubiquinone-9 3-methyltransferase (glyoxalase superfamily)